MSKYEGWDARKHNTVINALNKGLPAEECGVELNNEERESYEKDLRWLLEERERHPNIPISYDLVELE